MGSDPGADEAAGKKVQDDEPVGKELWQGDTDEAGWQGRDDDDQAHGLVHDDGLQRGETEDPDEQGQPEFGTAETDHAAKDADDGAGEEDHSQGLLSCLP
jgi:hypothetical protein